MGSTKGSGADFKVSETAEVAILELAQAREKYPEGLVVGVRGGGCNGFEYHFEWTDSDVQWIDAVFVAGDRSKPHVRQVPVFSDKKSLLFLSGATLHYASGLTGSGFFWDNPNEKGSCGCKKSVSF